MRPSDLQRSLHDYDSSAIHLDNAQIHSPSFAQILRSMAGDLKKEAENGVRTIQNGSTIISDRSKRKSGKDPPPAVTQNSVVAEAQPGEISSSPHKCGK